MKEKIKARWRSDLEPGLIQIRATSTANVLVDIFLTEDQIYGLVEALKNGTLPEYEIPKERKEWIQL